MIKKIVLKKGVLKNSMVHLCKFIINGGGGLPMTMLAVW